MGGLVSYNDVKKQSEQVFGQFGDAKWLPYARENSKLERRSLDELANIGVGRSIVLATMGESTEEKIEIIKKYRDRYHLAVNDKLFGYMVERGITPDFVFLSDSNIPFRWLEKHVEKTDGVRLIATPYANVEWTRAWRGPRYFYVNADVIQSERFFKDAFPGVRIIPASSNVSNSMVCFFTGMVSGPPINWGGYERYILVGYDYSWRPLPREDADAALKTGKYYAFEDPQPKRFYMFHRTLQDINGDLVHTSENLFFSARWLWSFVAGFGVPLINCSGRGLLNIPLQADLEEEVKSINADPAAVESVKAALQGVKTAHDALAAAKGDYEKIREVLTYGRRE
jgi:hypothetical protein